MTLLLAGGHSDLPNASLKKDV